MVIYPKLPPYILQDWVTSIVNHGTIFSEQEILTIKNVIIYIIHESCRSRMNVVFRLPNEDLEAKFVKEAKAAGMIGLKGHRSVGGIRASIYNAVPMEGVEKLINFMNDFKKAN